MATPLRRGLAGAAGLTLAIALLALRAVIEAANDSVCWAAAPLCAAATALAACAAVSGIACAIGRPRGFWRLWRLLLPGAVGVLSLLAFGACDPPRNGACHRKAPAQAPLVASADAIREVAGARQRLPDHRRAKPPVGAHRGAHQPDLRSPLRSRVRRDTATGAEL